MKVLACYARVFPETRNALAKFAPDAELVDVSGSDFAYWEAIKARWTGDTDLVIIEHDVEITEDTLPSFESCPHDWCYYAYRGDASFDWRLEACLGCTKFSKQLQLRFPAAEMADWIVWFSIDNRIGNVLRPTYEAHDHGDVKHHHPYPSGPMDPSEVHAPLPRDHNCEAERCLGGGTHFYSWYGFGERGDGTPGAAYDNWMPQMFPKQ